MHRLPKIPRVGDWRGKEKMVCVCEREGVISALLFSPVLFCICFQFRFSYFRFYSSEFFVSFSLCNLIQMALCNSIFYCYIVLVVVVLFSVVAGRPSVVRRRRRRRRRSRIDCRI